MPCLLGDTMEDIFRILILAVFYYYTAILKGYLVDYNDIHAFVIDLSKI